MAVKITGTYNLTEIMLNPVILDGAGKCFLFHDRQHNLVNTLGTEMIQKVKGAILKGGMGFDADVMVHVFIREGIEVFFFEVESQIGVKINNGKPEEFKVRLFGNPFPASFVQDPVYG